MSRPSPQKAAEPAPASSTPAPAGPAPAPAAPSRRRASGAVSGLTDPRLGDPRLHREASARLRAAQRSAGNDAVARALADRSTGEPLPAPVASEHGARLGRSFEGVRVHTDPHAAELARGLGAKAFARGRDLYFGAGRFAPATQEGRRLLGHELTHVAQHQNTLRRKGSASTEGSLEAEAREAATRPGAEIRGRAAADSLLRDPLPGSGPRASSDPSPGFSFAPIDWSGIDVAAMPARELLAELRSNGEWLEQNGVVLLEWHDRSAYQARLSQERQRRIQAGQVWLNDPDAERLPSVLTLEGAGDRIQVSSFPAAGFLDATPTSSSQRRVLSPAQFESFLQERGIPIVPQADWELAQQLVRQGTIAGTAANPWNVPHYGAVVGDRFQRGFTSSGAHGVVAEAQWGASQGGLDLNQTWWADSRLQNQPFDNVFLRQSQRYGPFWTRRPFSLGPSQGRSGPNPGWIDSGAGWQRGNYPLADFDSRNPFAISPVSIKASIRDDWAGRRDFFTEGHAALVGTDQRGGGGSQAAYLRNAPPGTTAADVANAGRLAINPEDVQRLQDLYRNPLAVEAPYVEDGRTVTPQGLNVERAGIRRVLNGYLRAGGPVVINGQTYSTVEQLLLAFNDGNGSITRQQLLSALQPAANQAANAVVSHETPRATLNAMIALRRAQGPGSRRALTWLGTGEHFANQLYGRPRATAISTGRGGAGGMLIGGGLQTLGVLLDPDAYDDPAGAIFEASALGLVSGGAQSALEHQFASRAAERALTSGAPVSASRALTTRANASGRAGGLVAGAIEVGRILTEDEEHTATEVVVRVGRAGGIGYVSAAAGAAVGTAIGGPIGFVAGLVVGIAVGAVLEAVVPKASDIVEAIEEMGEAIEWGIKNDPAVFILPAMPTLRNYSRYGSAFPRVRSPLDAMRDMENQQRQ